MNHSEEMITEHFDILNIIKDLRDLKVLITNQLMTKSVKQTLMHQKDRLIEVDSSSDFDAIVSDESSQTEATLDPKEVEKILAYKIVKRQLQKSRAM